MSGVIIKRCKCKHAYQDKCYGKGMRVHNLGVGKLKSAPVAECTVCKSTK